jgi:hypothetical protein
MTHLTVLNSAKERKWADSQKCSTALQNEQREEVSTCARTALYVHVCIHVFMLTCIWDLFIERMLTSFVSSTS